MHFCYWLVARCSAKRNYVYRELSFQWLHFLCHKVTATFMGDWNFLQQLLPRANNLQKEPSCYCSLLGNTHETIPQFVAFQQSSLHSAVETWPQSPVVSTECYVVLDATNPKTKIYSSNSCIAQPVSSWSWYSLTSQIVCNRFVDNGNKRSTTDSSILGLLLFICKFCQKSTSSTLFSQCQLYSEWTYIFSW